MPASANPASKTQGEWAGCLARASAGALYLHVPFCARKCAYCDFASWETSPDDPLMRAYVESLLAQANLLSHAGLLDGCETAYVGGGTPTLLGGHLAALTSGAAEAIASGGGGLLELTVEANPESLSDEVLAALPHAGVTRVSMGVQSLDDAELAALGRIHTATRARNRIEAVQKSGIDLSVDLMCATPGQTDASWERTLQEVTDLGVGHVSVYPLQVEDGTPMEGRVELELEKSGEKWPAWNSDEVQASRMELAEKTLARARLSRYEVASYSTDGRECRHNIAYWTGVPYLGLGTGASSMLTRKGYERLRGACCPQLPELVGEVARVRLTIASGRAEIARDSRMESLRFSTELLDERQAAAEDLMLGARLSRGISPGLLAHARDVLGEANVDDVVSRVVGEGLASWTQDGFLAPTERGWLLGNELYGELWGLA